MADRPTFRAMLLAEGAHRTHGTGQWSLLNIFSVYGAGKRQPDGMFLLQKFIVYIAVANAVLGEVLRLRVHSDPDFSRDIGSAVVAEKEIESPIDCHSLALVIENLRLPECRTYYFEAVLDGEIVSTPLTLVHGR